MKYDIYKGTKEDMREHGGELFLKKINKAQVMSFCKRHGINSVDFLDSNHIIADDGSYWLEEAM